MQGSGDWVRERSGQIWIFVCGKYRIVAMKSTDEIRYIPWPPKPKMPPVRGDYNWEDHVHHSLGVYDSPQEARDACKEHYDKYTKK